MADLLFDGWQGALLRMKIERSAAPLNSFIESTLLGACRLDPQPTSRADSAAAPLP